MINPFIKDDLDIGDVLSGVEFGISDNLESYFSQMTPIDFKVLVYLVNRLTKTGNDIVHIKVASIMNDYNIKSKDSVYNSIKAMETISLLRKKHASDYWVNPFLINFTTKDYYKNLLKIHCRDVYPNLYIKYYTGAATGAATGVANTSAAKSNV